VSPDYAVEFAIVGSFIAAVLIGVAWFLWRRSRGAP